MLFDKYIPGDFVTVLIVLQICIIPYHNTLNNKFPVQQISQPTINRDITFLMQQAKDNIKKYIGERLPEEYAVDLTINGFTEYLRLH